jgi:hypothetical protein
MYDEYLIEHAAHAENHMSHMNSCGQRLFLKYNTPKWLGGYFNHMTHIQNVSLQNVFSTKRLQRKPLFNSTYPKKNVSLTKVLL